MELVSRSQTVTLAVTASVTVWLRETNMERTDREVDEVCANDVEGA